MEKYGGMIYVIDDEICSQADLYHGGHPNMASFLMWYGVVCLHALVIACSPGWVIWHTTKANLRL